MNAYNLRCEPVVVDWWDCLMVAQDWFFGKCLLNSGKMSRAGLTDE